MGPGIFDLPEPDADEMGGPMDGDADDGMEALAADMLAAVEAKDAATLAELLRSIKGS